MALHPCQTERRDEAFQLAGPPLSRSSSALLKKCATGSASAEKAMISRNWQSQWHTKFRQKLLFQQAASGVKRISTGVRKGFSLLELMIVVTLIGILAAMATPSYLQAVRQARADIAGANLRAIWAAQRLYWLEYHSYTDKLQAQTAPAIGLVDLGLLDPVIFSSGNYTYQIASFSENAFSATATSPDNDITITIDETGEVGSTDITLGFQ